MLKWRFCCAQRTREGIVILAMNPSRNIRVTRREYPRVSWLHQLVGKMHRIALKFRQISHLGMY